MVSSGCPISSVKEEEWPKQKVILRERVLVKKEDTTSVLDYIYFSKDLLPYILHDLKEKVSYIK